MKPTAGRLVILALALSSSAALRGQTFEVFHQFDLPGPGGPDELIQDSDGSFYGVSQDGGTVSPFCIAGCGTVYRMDGDGAVTILHEFTRNDDDGSSPGGFFPLARLLRASNGDLYGTTIYGGPCLCGTIFRIDSNGIFTTVHTFVGTDGDLPAGSLIEPQPGDLWGTTGAGGSGWPTGGDGTIFRMHFNGDLETMHEFSGSDGSLPSKSLLLADDGNLYGSTFLGGSADSGNLFRITLNGNLTVLHEFTGGNAPRELIQSSSGNLIAQYIGTLSGADRGGVYRITLDGDVQVLHAFASDGHEGSQHVSRLLQADDGFFYGTANQGGLNNKGTVFRLGENGNFTVIHDFGGDPDGRTPQAGLMQAADGRLYSTTYHGGDGGTEFGVAYRIMLPGSPPRFFCAADFVRRDQMAVFLLKIEHGAAYVPPPCTGQFPDVACPGLFADWVEELAAEGITAGCGGGDYCPLSAITRAQMAVFLLKTEHGTAYAPPPCSGAFPDVACPSLFGAWIEQLAAEGITAGCGLGNFCPDAPVTRAQMAVFLLKIEHGPAFAPPACQYIFTDVACPSQFANWVEALYAEDITAGCAGP